MKTEIRVGRDRKGKTNSEMWDLNPISKALIYLILDNLIS